MIEQKDSDAIVDERLALNVETQIVDVEKVKLENVTRRPRRFTFQSGATPLAGYTIKRGIGIGGFGEVYFAISDAGKEVALKRIQRNLDVEIRGVSQCLNLKHINLIALWDIRQDEEGESWVVMEYVPGDSLRDVLERSPNGVSMEDARKWFSEILAGVQYLHDHGIVHRDLKPANIFYDQDEKVVKIGDYGLSKFISTSKRDGQTESVGTFHYMAPEIGKGSYGKEIDVYSLGIILCEIVSGQVPFDGESGQEIMMKHLTANPELHFIPPQFRPVVEKALAKDPAHRYGSVEELSRSLRWDADTTLDSLGQAPGTSGDNVNQGGNRQALVQPMFIRDDEPMYISDDDIQIGELKVSHHGIAGSDLPTTYRAPHVPVKPDADGAAKAELKRTRQVVSDQNELTEREFSVVSTTTLNQSEPVAKAVNTGVQRLTNWWNGLGGTPVKIVLVAILALFVLVNAEFLIPASVALGVAYLVYFFLRSTVLRRPEKSAGRSATVIRPFSRKECVRIVESRLREHRRQIPFAEKLSETLGAILTAAIVVAISSVVAIGFTGFSLTGSPATLSLIVWIAFSALLASGTCILFAKVFESSEGNQWIRRFILMSSGALVSLASYGLYQYFLVSEVQVPRQVLELESPIALMGGATDITRFVVFFALLFAAIRWWKVGDPLRKTQFSVVRVILHSILAIGVAALTMFPVLWAVMIVGAMSVAVQMSTTWISTRKRERLQLEIMQSQVA